jgi:hypothetical protein
MSVTEFDSTARASTWREPRTLLACSTLALALALTACGGSAKSSQSKGSGSGSTPAATNVATKSAPATAGSTAGAGSAGSGSTSLKPGGDFCSLVTLDQARAVLGRAVAPGLSRTGATPGGVSGSCVYKDKPAVGKPPTVVNMMVLGSTFPRAAYDQELKGNPDAPVMTPVSGLGEDAFSIPGVVTLFDHGLVLSLQIMKDGVPVDTATITDLLRVALGRAQN